MTAISGDRVIGVQYTPITEEDVFKLNTAEKHTKQHTLETFAIDHFRPPPKSSISRRQGILTKDLWSHTKVPMKMPLLKSLQNEPQLAKQACEIFKRILKYSGEYPTQKTNQACAFTDGIFDPALREPRLRDEVYCQIIKQLTGNKANNDISGWELMWLVTGTFPCTAFIREEVDKFLNSARRRWLADDCMERLQRTLRHGCRMYPPNLVEVETIKFKMTKILNTVFYPNDTEGYFEVHSATKVKDFLATVSERLELKSSNEFKLFAKIGDTVVSMPADMFFYDYMRHDHLAAQARPPKTDTNPDEIYKVVALIFMRKMWSKMVPGEDPVADDIFHYHQEMPKFLRGWHKCSKDDVLRLAALILRVKMHAEEEKLQKTKKKLEVTETTMPGINEMVPRDMRGSMMEREWKKEILAAYTLHKDEHKTPLEAKTEFLKIVYQWPTFGSAFVSVTQTCLPDLRDDLLIAANKNGLVLMDPDDKNELCVYPYKQILLCAGNEQGFELTLMAPQGQKKTKLKFETDLGYKIADLTMSYKESSRHDAKRGAEL